MTKRMLPFALAALSLAVLGWLVRGHLGELGGLADVSPWALAAIASLFFVGRALGGVLIWIGLAAMGFAVRLRVCGMIAIVTSYTNLILPRSGTAPSALYLRARYGVPVSGYLSFAVASTLVSTALVGATGLVLALALSPDEPHAMQQGVIALLAAITGLATLGVVAPARGFAFLPVWLRTRLARADEAWRRLAENPVTLLRIISIQFVTIFVRATKSWVALAAAGVDVSFTDALWVSIAADIGMLISITPAALGFREAGVLFGAAFVGIAPGPALLAAVIDRLVCTAGILTAGQGVIGWGLGDFRRIYSNVPSQPGVTGPVHPIPNDPTTGSATSERNPE